MPAKDLLFGGNTEVRKVREFLLKFALVYALWRLFSFLFFKAPFWLIFKDKLAAATTLMASWMVAPFTDERIILYLPRYIILRGSNGIFVGDLCLAIPAMVIFTAFIAVYSGSWKHKLWFIPLGLFVIYLINSFRVASMAYIQRYYSQEVFDFNHSYVYVIMVYSFIFLMIKLWMDKFYQT